MSTEFPSPLVDCDWLAGALDRPDIRLLDCTWHPPSSNLDGRTQYRGRHIPGAVHFDIDHIADRSNPLPHTLPTAADFAAKVGLLGIDNDAQVIVYDRHGGGSAAARVWWMFRCFGHHRVAMLDGGFATWCGEKRPTEMSAIRPVPQRFTSQFQPGWVRYLADIEANLTERTAQLVDARGAALFAGHSEDLPPGQRAGHIPGSVNLPWHELVDPATGIFRPKEAVASRFQDSGLDLTAPIIATCGSGVTAPVLALALAWLGHPQPAVYDGSWAEWSLQPNRPVATTESCLGN